MSHDRWCDRDVLWTMPPCHMIIGTTEMSYDLCLHVTWSLLRQRCLMTYASMSHDHWCDIDVVRPMPPCHMIIGATQMSYDLCLHVTWSLVWHRCLMTYASMSNDHWCDRCLTTYASMSHDHWCDTYVLWPKPPCHMIIGATEMSYDLFLHVTWSLVRQRVLPMYASMSYAKHYANTSMT